jgi:hypothetical protein
MGDARVQLQAVLQLENETERKLGVAALIDDLVRELGFRAIVIGGVAVEFCALTGIERLAERVAAGEILESYELHEVASGLPRNF